MKTAKQMLAEIDQFFSDHSEAVRAASTMAERRVPDEEGRKLWDVLSALRGPDDHDLRFCSDVKLYTTARIRAMALPNTAGKHFACNVIPATFNPDGGDVMKHLPAQDHEHFVNHIRYALGSLAEMRNEP